MHTSAQHTPTGHPTMKPCCQDTYGQTTPYRTYSAGRGQPEVCGPCIERQAVAAALAGHCLVDACPYPFFTEAGQFFKATFYKTQSEAKPS